MPSFVSNTSARGFVRQQTRICHTTTLRRSALQGAHRQIRWLDSCCLGRRIACGGTHPPHRSEQPAATRPCSPSLESSPGTTRRSLFPHSSGCVLLFSQYSQRITARPFPYCRCLCPPPKPRAKLRSISIHGNPRGLSLGATTVHPNTNANRLECL